MTVMVMRPLKGVWAVAVAIVAAALAAAVRATSLRRSLTCLTTCSVTSWGDSGAAADAVPHAVPICAITSGLRSKTRIGACRSRSTCPPLWPAIPVTVPGQKAAQSRPPAPPVPVWARSVLSRAFSRSNAPVRPVRAWARSSRTPVNPAAVPGVLKKTVRCR